MGTVKKIIEPAEAMAARKSINKLIARYKTQTAEFLLAVGKELKVAQIALAKHKAGFGDWCEMNFGWTPSHCRRIIHACEMIELLSKDGVVDGAYLPTNEHQFRELRAIPKQKLPSFWKQFKDENGSNPVTSESIKSSVKKFLGVVDAVSVTEIQPKYVSGAAYIFNGSTFVLVTSDEVSESDKLAAVNSILATSDRVKEKVASRLSTHLR